jgi:hypothetical protein|nr:MAG TPA: Protein of unknown function (DUF1804) [Caudoviricetes sp.]
MNFGKAMRLIFDANIGFKIRRNKKAVKVLNYFSHSRFGMPSLHKKEHMTTPKHKLYTAAYNCFVEQGMTCAGIAELLGIREATLSEWRRGMKWDEKRKASLAAPGKIRELLLDEMQWIAEGNKARLDTDGLSKVAKSLQYFDGKVPLSVVISVLKEVDNFVAEINPQEVVKITEYHRMFIQHRAQVDSLK